MEDAHIKDGAVVETGEGQCQGGFGEHSPGREIVVHAVAAFAAASCGHGALFAVTDAAGLVLVLVLLAVTCTCTGMGGWTDSYMYLTRTV